MKQSAPGSAMTRERAARARVQPVHFRPSRINKSSTCGGEGLMTARGLSYMRTALKTGLCNRLQAKACASASRQRKSAYTTHQMIPPPAQYGGRHTVTLIPGDGIGPELVNHVQELFRFCCVPVDFEVVNVDSSAASEDDINNAIMAIRRNGVALKGNLETNHNLPPSYKSRNNLLRTTLDLYANVMHCRSLPGVPSRHHDIDILIIRENTEGEYSSLEHELVSRPQQFDVMVMPNLYGSVVSNICAGLVGGPGLVPGANYGRDYAVFETGTRNTGRSIANRNTANPTAMLLASCLLLDHLKLRAYAAMIRRAVLGTVTDARLHTQDLGGQGSTSEVVHFIMKAIQSTGPLTVSV
ncbi:isocitrate dehydrogenase [NAD] subunit gamma 1, mitochondrial-like isoform X2 [Phycodurus eques]|uniref:isocitrate dehydrogenase [NAD] subunit gamma 1, mitochondrial-like isoform X2 n=1 Tax=Phycodurus eques TaxID=693459 RepID=UPI002ACD6819|nr:isocitrate dehydrogenase [NAD] subunit gamma 1, mitochondrial-like isoform X2 [Phycodurus eques]